MRKLRFLKNLSSQFQSLYEVNGFVVCGNRWILSVQPLLRELVKEALLFTSSQMLQCKHCYKASWRRKKTLTAKENSGYKEWLEDQAQELVTLVTARSTPQPLLHRATSEHEGEKHSQRRRILKQCVLSRSGTDACVYGCDTMTVQQGCTHPVQRGCAHPVQRGCTHWVLWRTHPSTSSLTGDDDLMMTFYYSAA